MRMPFSGDEEVAMFARRASRYNFNGPKRSSSGIMVGPSSSEDMVVVVRTSFRYKSTRRRNTTFHQATQDDVGGAKAGAPDFLRYQIANLSVFAPIDVPETQHFITSSLVNRTPHEDAQPFERDKISAIAISTVSRRCVVAPPDARCQRTSREEGSSRLLPCSRDEVRAALY